MNFYFYSPVHFEKWDYRNSVTKGIGGSETSHVEMVWRLARRGHKVISYAPIPKDCPREWRGTTWLPLNKADFSQKGVWVIYRSPETLELFKNNKKNKQVWFISQDEWYPTWKKEYAEYVDRFFAFCPAHKDKILKHHKELKGKVFITSNGLKMELLRETEKLNIKRDPNKLIYASSPDRGLMHLLKIFKRAREYNPALTLHVFYGFNNIDKLIKYQTRFSYFKKVKSDIEALMDQPGVVWRGRVSQQQLYKEWFSAGIWCYPTNFTETSCITSMEAQAMGAIPITNPYWALADNVLHGVFVEGDAWGDSLMQARYTAEIVRMSNNPQFQDQLRPQMMTDARLRFNWERFVDQWEALLYGYEGLWISQFNFQLKYATGKILNVGCDIDPAGFGKRGAVNIDIVKVSPILKIKTKADIIADARDLPKSLHGKFDTVILGDILEHMNDEDIVKSLRSAKLCGRKIVITCPDDSRPIRMQHKVSDNEGYIEGISSYHERPISKEHLTSLIDIAGLTISMHQPIDYTHFLGNGFVVV